MAFHSTTSHASAAGLAELLDVALLSGLEPTIVRTGFIWTVIAHLSKFHLRHLA